MVNQNDIALKCPYCDYYWEYSGDMDRATCPSCSNKVPVEENKIEE